MNFVSDYVVRREAEFRSRAMRHACGAAALAVAALAPSAAAPAQTADGQRLFQQRCAACHAVGAGPAKSGPQLAGVVGRRAASVPGARYSEALRKSGIVWDRASLDAYLAAPRQKVPGTTMLVSVPNAAQRQAIVTYLTGAR